MKPAAVLLGMSILAGCVTQVNTYMPPEHRKPMDGPDPRNFTSTHRPTDATAKTRGAFRLTAPAGRVLKLDARMRAPEGGATVRWVVNARDLGEAACAGDCAIEKTVPAGTIVAGTAAVVEFESSSPVVLVQASLLP